MKEIEKKPKADTEREGGMDHWISSCVTLGELIITNIPKYSRFDGIPKFYCETDIE